MSPLSNPDLLPGALIEFRLDDGDGCEYHGEGRLHQLDLVKKTIKVKECREMKSKVKESGIQVFDEDEILELKVTEKSQEMSLSSRLLPRPEAVKSLAKPPRRSDNPHLSKLHSIQMNEVLTQVQCAAPPDLAVLELQPHKPRYLPPPEQDMEHMEGDKFKDRQTPEFAAARKHFWHNLETPRELKAYPEKIYYVDNWDCYKYAMKILEEQSVVGLGLEGQVIGRKGQLGLLTLSTKKAIYVFDFLAFEPQAFFDGGIGELLQDDGVMKVLHDSRQASDMLWNKFNIEMRNVYDILAAHAVFLSWGLYAGYMPKYAATVSCLARCYYGIKGAYLHFPHYRAGNLREDTAIWLQRPLPSNLEIGAVRNVAYLLDLQRATREVMNTPFYKATEALLADVRDSEEMDAEIKLHDPHVLPPSLISSLPPLRPDSYRASKWGVVEEGKRAVHNCVGQMDPNLIFSRDCLHQNKARLGKP